MSVKCNLVRTLCAVMAALLMPVTAQAAKPKVEITGLPSNVLPLKYGTSAVYQLSGSINGRYRDDAEWSVAASDAEGFELSDTGTLTVTPETSGSYLKIKCLIDGSYAEETVYFDDTGQNQGGLAWVGSGWSAQAHPPQYAVDGNPDTYWSAGAHTAGSEAKLCIDTGGAAFNRVRLRWRHLYNSGSAKLYASDTVGTDIPAQSGVTSSTPALLDATLLYETDTPHYETEQTIAIADTTAKYLLYCNGIEDPAAEPFELSEISLHRATAGDLAITDLPDQLLIPNDGATGYHIGTLVYDSLGAAMPDLEKNGKVQWQCSAPDGVTFDSEEGLLTVAADAAQGEVTLTAELTLDNCTLKAKAQRTVTNGVIEVINDSGEAVQNVKKGSAYRAAVKGGSAENRLIVAEYHDGIASQISSAPGDETAEITVLDGDRLRAYYFSPENVPLASVWEGYTDGSSGDETDGTAAYQRMACNYLARTMVGRNFSVTEQFADIRKSSQNDIALALDFSGVLVYGTRYKMKACPKSDAGDIEIPAEVICAAGGSYTAEQGGASVAYQGGSYWISMTEDGYVKAQDLAGVFQKPLKTWSNGLILYTDQTLFSESEADDYLTLLHYDRPTAQEVFDAMTKRGGARPGVIADQTVFDRVKEELSYDENVKAWYAALQKRALSYMDKPVTEYEVVNNRLLTAATQVYTRVSELAFLYKITGDTAYASRAWLELEAAANFPDWHSSHYLDVAEMSLAFAVGYDWLYDTLTQEQRLIMARAFEKNAVDTFNYCMHSGRGGWLNHRSNWNIWVRNGIISGILAMYEDLEHPGAAAAAFEKAMVGLEIMIDEFAPDGAWVEGTAYWNTTVTFMAQLISTLENKTGRYYGYDNLSGFPETAYFSTHLTGAGGVFNYADTTVRRDNPAVEFWFSDRLEDEGLKNLRLQNMKDYNLSSSLLDILWYTPPKSDVMPQLKDDIVYEKLGIASFRSGWDKTAAFAAVKGAEIGASHFHYDGGTFVYDWGGARFAYELGRDSYATTTGENARRYNYKIRAEGHNTLVINPGEDPGQKDGAAATMVRSQTDDTKSFTILDLTALYQDTESDDGYTGRDIKRGFMLDKQTGALTVRDEIHLTKASELYWFMHTGTQITLSADQKSAVIDQNGVKVKAELFCDTDARFDVMDAWILDTTPEYPGQGKNNHYKKLAVHMQNVQDTQITVTLTPVTEDMPQPTVKPLNEW